MCQFCENPDSLIIDFMPGCASYGNQPPRNADDYIISHQVPGNTREAYVHDIGDKQEFSWCCSIHDGNQLTLWGGEEDVTMFIKFCPLCGRPMENM